MKTSTFIIFATAALVGCHPAPNTEPRTDPRILTQQEIAASGMGGSAYDVISRLRPAFLRTRGETSVHPGPTTAYPSVYLDGNPYGDITSLRNLDAINIAEIRLYQSWEAQTKFGLGNPNGVIAITSRR